MIQNLSRYIPKNARQFVHTFISYHYIFPITTMEILNFYKNNKEKVILETN